MGVIYKYTDLSDGICKYVGIVYADGRSIHQRAYEHFKNDEWCKGDFKIEYMPVKSRTDASAYESHYIALYETYKYFNKDKSDWGTSEYLPNRDSEWVALPYTNLKQMRHRKYKVNNYVPNRMRQEEYIKKLKDNSYANQFIDLISSIQNGSRQEMLDENNRISKRKIREHMGIKTSSNFSNKVLRKSEVVEYCQRENISISGQYIRF